MLRERRGCLIHVVSAPVATLLATFTEQASAEEMPVRETIRVTPRWGIPRYALVLWPLIAVVLIGVALALSG